MSVGKQSVRVVEVVDGVPQCKTCPFVIENTSSPLWWCTALDCVELDPASPPPECRMRDGSSVLVIGEDQLGPQHGGMERFK